MYAYYVKNEADAIKLFRQLQSEFGWAGNIFTRDDAAAEWARQAAEYGEPTEMTDLDWECVQRTHEWSRSMSECLHEVLDDRLRRAVSDGMIAAVRAQRTANTITN